MKYKFSTIRVKLLLALLQSVGFAGLCVLLFSIFMILASASKPFAIFFNQHVIEFILLFILIFAALVLAFFALLIKSKVIYMEEITKSLKTIAGGNLEVHIPVKTNDELGEMAKTVNYMAGRLKSSMEEERSAENAKNELITNISHDLRTPLTSITGYLDLITKTDCKDEEKLKRYSKQAYHECLDLKVLIEELFEFTKLNNTGIKLTFTRFSVGELLEQVILGFMPAIQDSDLEIRIKLPDEKIEIEADLMLIKRAFENLIGNSIKYGRAGQYIDVEFKRDHDTALVHISNYGEMIPEKDLPNIFKKFYRASQARNNSSEGSGLGLAIVKSIMQLHEGDVHASSANGKTTFTIRLRTNSR